MVLLSSDSRKLLVLRKIGVELDSENLCKLCVGQPLAGDTHQMDDRVLHGSVFGEECSLMFPQTFLVELRDTGQGVEAAALVVAAQNFPFVEPSFDGSDGALQERTDLRDGEDLEAFKGAENLGFVAGDSWSHGSSQL